MKSGIINVYKEKDFTSFDVVAKLRGILKIRKIGHVVSDFLYFSLISDKRYMERPTQGISNSEP